jgi:hypothetical protein
MKDIEKDDDGEYGSESGSQDLISLNPLDPE